MSSMVMTKDHDGRKRGAVVSVPFGIGRTWIEQGVARYLSDGPVVVPAAAPAVQPTPPVIQQTPVITPVVEQPKREPAKHEPEKKPFARSGGSEKHK